MVSGGYFPTLGVDPMLGHTFGLETDKGRNAHPIAIVSYGYWDRKLQRDPSAVGRKIHIRNMVFEIGAVMPPDFAGIDGRRLAGHLDSADDAGRDFSDPRFAHAKTGIRHQSNVSPRRRTFETRRHSRAGRHFHQHHF